MADDTLPGFDEDDGAVESFDSTELQCCEFCNGTGLRKFQSSSNED